jgi:hypothetical protein
MMGSKKLNTVRRELRQALRKTGDNPIQWLDKRIRALERAGKSPTSTDVLHSLRRVLQTPSKSKRRPKAGGVKK